MTEGWVKLTIFHDGERVGAVELSPEAVAMCRDALESLAKLASAVESFAETQIALAALHFKEGNDGGTVSNPQRPPGD